MLTEVLERLDTRDVFAAVEYLACEEPAAAMDAYGALARHLYWERRDLSALVLLARSGNQGATKHVGNPVQSHAVRA